MGSGPTDDDAQQPTLTPFENDDAIVEHEVVSTPQTTGRILLGAMVFALLLVLLVITVFVLLTDSETDLATNQPDSADIPAATSTSEPQRFGPTTATPTTVDRLSTEILTDRIEDFGLVIWMQPNATDQDIEALQAVLSSERSVSSVTYISQEATFNAIEQQFPELPTLLSPTVPADLASRFEVFFGEDAYQSQLTRIATYLPEMAGVRDIEPGNQEPINLPDAQEINYGIAEATDDNFTLKVDRVGLVRSADYYSNPDEIAAVDYSSPPGPDSAIIWYNVPATGEVVVLESGAIRFWQRPFRQLVAFPYPEGAEAHFELIVYDSDGNETDRLIYNVGP